MPKDGQTTLEAVSKPLQKILPQTLFFSSSGLQTSFVVQPTLLWKGQHLGQGVEKLVKATCTSATPDKSPCANSNGLNRRKVKVIIAPT